MLLCAVLLLVLLLLYGVVGVPPEKVGFSYTSIEDPCVPST